MAKEQQNVDELATRVQNVQLSTSKGSIKYAYHVTNLEVTATRFEELRPSIANDRTYDGDLLGLPVVPLTTTLSGSGTLPTISPYPRTGRDERMYQRVKIPLSNFEGYNWWLMHSCERQVHILFTTADGHWSKMLSKSLNTEFKMINQAGFEHLTFKDGQWTVNYYRPGPFVNIFILKTVPLNDRRCEWDTVKRKIPDIGHGELVEFSCTDPSHCKSKWIWEKVVGMPISEDPTKANEQLDELKSALESWKTQKCFIPKWNHFESAEVMKQWKKASTDPELLSSVYYILCEDKE